MWSIYTVTPLLGLNCVYLGVVGCLYHPKTVNGLLWYLYLLLLLHLFWIVCHLFENFLVLSVEKSYNLFGLETTSDRLSGFKLFTVGQVKVFHLGKNETNYFFDNYSKAPL